MSVLGTDAKKLQAPFSRAPGIDRIPLLELFACSSGSHHYDTPQTSVLKLLDGEAWPTPKRLWPACVATCIFAVPEY